MITSLQNPKIKRLVALRKRRDREEVGVMVVEGHDELAVAMQSGARPRELYYCPELMGTADEILLREVTAAGAELEELSREAFEKAAYRESPDGWLGVFEAIDASLEHLRVGPKPLILVCEAVEKPGNLGAMLRTADAVGATALIAVDAVTDWGNPNIVRASKGTIFTVPVVETTRPELLDWLKQHDIKLVAATPEASLVYTDADLSGGVAIAVGAEHEGLSQELMAAARERVVIPMAGQVNSLNVATSAALLLYEALRQRAKS